MATPVELFQHAQQKHQQGEFLEASELYKQALALAPQNPDILHMLGVCLAQIQDFGQAVSYLQHAVKLEPNHAHYRHNLGEAYRRMGDFKAAIEAYQATIQAAPNFAMAHFNLGNTLKAVGNLPAAIPCFQKAIELQPEFLKAYYNLANTLMSMGQGEEALEQYQALLQRQPQHVDGLNNRGVCLQDLERFDEAENSFARALQIDEGCVDAMRNLAQLFHKKGLVNQSREYFQLLAKHHPNDPLASIADRAVWTPFPADDAEIDSLRGDFIAAYEGLADTPGLSLDALEDRTVQPPFESAYQGRDELAFKKAIAQFYELRLPDVHYDPLPQREKIRVGFVVTQGHEGVFIKCMGGVIRELSRDAFEVYLICSAKDSLQACQRYFGADGQVYYPLSDKLPAAINQLHHAQCDILYYWEVGSDPMNYLLPMLRLAPVQATGWGWPVTSGMKNLDYFVSSEHLDTEANQAHYSESLYRLPTLPSYYYRPEMQGPDLAKAQLGLPEEGTMYFCAQNIKKVHPDFDGIVEQILAKDEAATVLFVHDKHPTVSDVLRQRLSQRLGSKITRVKFLNRTQRHGYLKRLSLVDVVLDTLHYCGGANTTYDAFSIGAPVVTLPGAFHRGQYTTAVYKHIGVNDLIATDVNDYVTKAVAIANDPDARAALSARIREASASLFEDRAVVAAWEAFFAHAAHTARQSS